MHGQTVDFIDLGVGPGWDSPLRHAGSRKQRGRDEMSSHGKVMLIGYK